MQVLWPRSRSKFTWKVGFKWQVLLHAVTGIYSSNDQICSCKIYSEQVRLSVPKIDATHYPKFRIAFLGRQIFKQWRARKVFLPLFKINSKRSRGETVTVFRRVKRSTQNDGVRTKSANNSTEFPKVGSEWSDLEVWGQTKPRFSRMKFVCRERGTQVISVYKVRVVNVGSPLAFLQL